MHGTVDNVSGFGDIYFHIVGDGSTPDIYNQQLEGEPIGYRYLRSANTSTGATGNQNTTINVDTNGGSDLGFNYDYEPIFSAGSQNALQQAEGTGSNMGIIKLHFGYSDQANNFAAQVVHNLNWDDTPPAFTQSGSVVQDGTA